MYSLCTGVEELSVKSVTTCYTPGVYMHAEDCNAHERPMNEKTATAMFLVPQSSLLKARRMSATSILTCLGSAVVSFNGYQQVLLVHDT